MGGDGIEGNYFAGSMMMGFLGVKVYSPYWPSMVTLETQLVRVARRIRVMIFMGKSGECEVSSDQFRE
jgi:hypothetical protein